MSLTGARIRIIKPLDKAYKVADEKGLYLLINTNGSKYWRMKYRFAGREKLLSIGIYPELSLSEARDKRDEARKQLANGIDPAILKKQTKMTASINAANSFEMIAREWHVKNIATWTEGHAQRILERLEKNVFPWLGSIPITDEDAPMLLSVLQRVENRRAIDTAHRILQNFGSIFRFAIATRYYQEKCDFNSQNSTLDYKLWYDSPLFFKINY